MIFKFSILLLLSACGVSVDDEKSTDSAQETDSSSSDSAEQDGFAPDPSPFSITISGDESLDLRFDSPICTHLQGSSNLRVFWRNASDQHVFVLVAEIMGGFDGPGSYQSGVSQGQVRVKLQEEAGGQARGYFTNTGEGDSAMIDIDLIEPDPYRLTGSATAQTLHGTNGQINLNPAIFPIWCPEIDQ